jgi:hypothetical protein
MHGACVQRLNNLLPQLSEALRLNLEEPPHVLVVHRSRCFATRETLRSPTFVSCTASDLNSGVNDLASFAPWTLLDASSRQLGCP